MARKYLVVVDMQEDFIFGPLGNDNTRAVVKPVVEKIKNFDGCIILTRDTHYKNYLETQEGKMLPVEHCIAYTDGWDFIEPIEELQMKGRWPIYGKNTFGCVNLAVDMRAEHVKQPIESITLIGVCTDICVVSNAIMLKAYLPDVPIYVDTSCCAGVTPQKHDAAIETMRSCQIIVE